MEKEFDPKIVGFTCNWCTYAGADLAGTSRIQYPHNIRIIRVMCSGRVDPMFVLKALLNGADGVFVGGCHPGDCHYTKGNYYARRRITALRTILKQFGFENRVRMEWVSASEGQKFANVLTEMVDDIKKLGPNPMKGEFL
ncbi:MAG: hydrogenase iron-sulfur subunit [Candidatus Syntropharchaeia archaeon]